MNNSSWSFLQINNVEQFYKAKQRTTHANHLCCVMRVTRLMPGTIATTKVKTQRNMHTNQSTLEKETHQLEHIGETRAVKQKTLIQAHIGETRAAKQKTLIQAHIGETRAAF
jgi:hypothetical protein